MWRSPPSATASAGGQRFKRDGEWHDVSYAELGETVSEIARGLIDLGIEPGDRVALLCTTRAEWTYVGLRDLERRRRRRADLPDQLARGVRVGGRATPSRAAIVCEDAAQVAKIVAVREQPARAAST